MKLDRVRVRGYRSAQDVELNGLGNFNVLIGKNNSGKSTVLFAIHAFYRCVGGGNVVSTNPPLGKVIDFTKDLNEVPIRITLTFSLQLAERDALVRDIATEAPQLKNATDGIDPSLQLEVTVTIPRSARRFSYVEEMSLINAASADRKTLLKVGAQATEELVAKFKISHEAKALTSEIKRLLNSIDEDDFQRMKRESPQSRSMAEYYLRRVDSSTAIGPIFDTALK